MIFENVLKLYSDSPIIPLHISCYCTFGGNYFLNDILCKECGLVFRSPFRRHLNCGNGCPNCVKKSRGEVFIEKFLKESEIEFSREVRFVDCRNIHPLPFDFMISKNGKFGIIEFHGIQHFEENKFFKHSLAQCQMNDLKKKEYAISKGFAYLEIPYYEISNIHDILLNFLSRF